MQRPPFRRLIARGLEVDRAVLFSVVGRAWASIAGIVTTLLIGLHFSPELQGFYYTFGSVIAFQVFAEMGLGTVLVYFASHEWAKLRLHNGWEIVGDPAARSRLSGLARFALVWYGIAGATLAVVLALAGTLFFAAAENIEISWTGPWFALSAITGVSLCLIPIWALLEGCNQVENAYRFKLMQFVATSIASWTAILNGAGLWTLAIGALAGLITSTYLLVRNYRGFMLTLLRKVVGPQLSWKIDILPMQWRISVSWISGFFTFSLFTPVLFYFHGPAVAGLMGMTWAFVSALMSVASSWITPKAPQFGTLVAQRKFEELDQLCKRLTWVVLAITTAGAAVIMAMVIILEHLQHPFSSRLLPAVTTGYLLLATIIVCLTLPASTYLRAHKKEPLLRLSLVSGVANGAAALLLGKYFSADGIAIGYLAVTLISTPLVAVILAQKRKEWHYLPPNTS